MALIRTKAFSRTVMSINTVLTLNPVDDTLKCMYSSSVLTVVSCRVVNMMTEKDGSTF